MDFSESDGLFTFEFWPAICDLMAIIVLLLMLILGTFYGAQGAIDLQRVRQHQDVLVRTLREEGFSLEQIGPDRVEVRSGAHAPVVMTLITDPTNPLLRRIVFSQDALFATDRDDLDARGRALLQRMGSAILRELETDQSDIVQIQIHGHADTRRSTRFRDNLELAGKRSEAVFRFLYQRGLSPIKYLMSATSFAEYCPIDRKPGQRFLPQDLSAANSSDDKRQFNRRLELLLFYRRR